MLMSGKPDKIQSRVQEKIFLLYIWQAVMLLDSKLNLKLWTIICKLGGEETNDKRT